MKNIKFVVLFLSFLFILPTSVYADEDEFILIDEDTKYLKTITYYDNSLYGTGDVLNTMYNSPSVTYEITKEEYEDAVVDGLSNFVINGSTVIETTYKSMTMSLLANGSYFRYKNVMNWKSMPAVRSYDVIAIGHLGNVEPAETPTFEMKYCLGGSNCYYNSVSMKQSFTLGSSAVYQLPFSSNLSLLRATYYFDAKKRNTSATVSTQAAYGDYAHAVTSVNLFNAMNHEIIQSAGIVFNTSTIEGYYDTTPEAATYWNGTW